MSTAEFLRPPGPGLPLGAGPRRLALVTIVIFGMSAWISLAVPLLGSRDFIGAMGPALCAVGAALTFREWRIGLVLAALGPIVAAACGRDPLAPGMLAVLVALLLALRGSSALLAGSAVAISNFVAGASYYGLADVSGRWPSIVVIAAVVTAAVGTAVRSRSEVRSGRAQHEADVERNRALTVQNAVAEERVRIARDLHDSIGHGIAIISMHVGTAQVVTPPSETDAHNSLNAARSAIQTVLEETQLTLQMLRTPEDGATSTPITHPDALPSLIRSAQAAGLELDYWNTARVDALPPAIAATSYRIVQEMLTNAQRHSAGRTALRVSSTDSSLTISSLNRIRQAGSRAGGNGLIGMRERAESVGGSLHVSARKDEFGVVAVIPLATSWRTA